MTDKQKLAVSLLNELRKYQNIDEEEYFLLLEFVTGEHIVTYNYPNTTSTVSENEPTAKAEYIRFEDIQYISVRLRSTLRYHEIETLGDAAKLTKKEWLSFPNCGKRSVGELRDILNRYGLDLRKE